jgi:hypothetical protein
MNARTVSLAALIALLPALAAADQVYKWVDEQGRVHFSQTPPPSAASNVQQVTVSAPPPDPQSLQNQQQLQKQQADKDQAAKDAAAKEQAKKDPKAEALQKQHCDDMRSRLQALQIGGRIATVDAQGNRSYVSDDDRVKQEQQLQDQLTKECGSAPR